MPDHFDAAPMEATATDMRPYSAEWYEFHRRTLGEAGCRQLGFYEFPPECLLSVVIPVYNEERTLRNLVDRVCAVPIRKELILVDDCSRDGTRHVLEELAKNPEPDPLNTFSIYYHDVNKGKGGALRTGFQHARGDFVIIQDADLEYDPSEYPRLLQPIIEDRADVVFGSRFLGDHPHRVLYFWHYPGKQGPHDAVQLLHEPQPHRHGDLLQSLSAGGDPSNRPVAETEPLRLRARNHGPASPAAAVAFTRCRSAIPAARTKRERKLALRTRSRPFGASCGTALQIRLIR